MTCAATTGGLFTENCIVVAEGELRRDGVFEARALGFPPAEKREESRSASTGIDFFGAGMRPPAAAAAAAEAEASPGAAADMLVLLADCWLDRPEVLAGLRTVFSGFAGLDTPPALFVLLGDFQSAPFGPASAGFGPIKGARDRSHRRHRLPQR